MQAAIRALFTIPRVPPGLLQPATVDLVPLRGTLIDVGPETAIASIVANEIRLWFAFHTASFEPTSIGGVPPEEMQLAVREDSTASHMDERTCRIACALLTADSDEYLWSYHTRVFGANYFRLTRRVRTLPRDHFVLGNGVDTSAEDIVQSALDTNARILVGSSVVRDMVTQRAAAGAAIPDEVQELMQRAERAGGSTPWSNASAEGAGHIVTAMIDAAP